VALEVMLEVHITQHQVEVVLVLGVLLGVLEPHVLEVLEVRMVVAEVLQAAVLAP
jgi:hypothetical protein